MKNYKNATNILQSAFYFKTYLLKGFIDTFKLYYELFKKISKLNILVFFSEKSQTFSCNFHLL